MPRVVLIRHTEVAAHWKGRCYGQSDAGLSAAGRQAAHNLANHFDIETGAVIFASPLRRARFLAGLIGHTTSTPIAIEPRLMECHFGSWEGRAWNDITAETGDAMMGMLAAPDTFRPGGGETTFELRNRAIAWLQSLAKSGPPIVAIAHGGPIAAIRGTLAGYPVADWPSLAPAYGERVELDV